LAAPDVEYPPPGGIAATDSITRALRSISVALICDNERKRSEIERRTFMKFTIALKIVLVTHQEGSRARGKN